MKKDKFKEKILQEKYVKLKQLIKNWDYAKLSDHLMYSAWKTEDKRTYDFIKCLIKSEKKKEKLLEYHLLAIAVLIYAMQPSYYCYKWGFYHAKKTINLEPENLSYKKAVLNIYSNPNARECIKKAEVKKIAKDVIAKDPEDAQAKWTLEYGLG